MARLLIAALLVAASILQPMLAFGPSIDVAQFYQLKDWKLEVSLIPEQASFMPGEPIYLAYTIRNESNEDLGVIIGADGDVNGRPTRFDVRAKREDGRVMPTRPSGGPGFGGMSGPQRIPAGGTYTLSLFLPEWLNFTTPGHYTITAARTLDIGKYARDFSWQNPGAISHLVTEASATVSVIPFSSEAFGEAIVARSRVMLASIHDGVSEDAATAAAKALAAISDEHAIPYFSRAATESRYSIKYIAVRALATFNNPDAVAALERAAHDSDQNVRLAAAFALSTNPYPRALDALLELRADPSWGIRNTVLQRLANMNSAESLDLIRRMTTDPDVRLRTEANRYLTLRTQAGEASDRVEAIYRFTLDGRPVQGTLWLYHYSWYGLEKYKLDDLQDGIAKVLLTRQILVEQVKPHPNVEAFIVALDVPGVGWHRSADIETARLFTDLMPAIDSLGVAEDRDGRRVVALAPAVRQTVELLSPTGTPQKGVEFTVESFVYNRNHCAAHFGFGDERTLRTDGGGRASFTAPLNPLYLPLGYYTTSNGPLGPESTAKVGLELPAGVDHVVRMELQPPPDERYVIHVRGSDGKAASGLEFVMRVRIDACGNHDRPLGRTDARGDIHVSFAPAEAEELWLQREGQSDVAANKVLSAADVRTLFATHQLTIVR
jgi:hypothetical protein